MLQISSIDGVSPFFIAGSLFFLLLVSFLLGVRVRQFKLKKFPVTSKDDLGSISGTLLGLLALLLAFTFGMSNSRFDDRRKLAIDEANAIGTAVLRADVYPDSMKNVLKSYFEEYLEARISFLQSGTDIDKLIEEFNRANKISYKVWTVVAEYAKTNEPITRTSEMIPALNAMIDITTSRRAAGEANIPWSIQYFLLMLCLTSTFLLGYERKNKFDWILVIGFSLILSMTIFTIFDMDRPRSGLVTLDEANSKMLELRSLF